MRNGTGSDVCRVFTQRTLGKDGYVECCYRALGKIYLFFFLFATKLFLLGLYIILNNICKFGLLLHFFAIFIQFISFDWISWNNSNLNYKSFKYCKTMNVEMIFVLLSKRWHLIHERTRNFKHFVQETSQRTCGSVGFKFYKIQIWSENNDTCRDVMI